MPIKGKINRSQGQHIRSKVFAEKGDEYESTPKAFNPLDMPQNTNLCCGNCQYWNFHVICQHTEMNVGCPKCGWEAKFKLPYSIKEGEIYYNSTLRCPYCQNDQFSFVRLGNDLSIGCSKCYKGVEMPLKNDENLIIT